MTDLLVYGVKIYKVKYIKLTSTLIVSDTSCPLITGSTDILGVIGGTEKEHVHKTI